jgi:peptidoglycan/LPS O-acetylase OafA/YrhL
MSQADRNLLFGILAVQKDLVACDAVIAAMHAWAPDKPKPLGRILVEHQVLTPAEQDLVEQLVDEHLAAHGGDAEQSLAATDGLGTIRVELITDLEIQATRDRTTHAADAAPNNPGAEQACSEDPRTFGSRLSIFRPHASGGPDRSPVARDSEPNRVVAPEDRCSGRAHDPASFTRFPLAPEITRRLERPGAVAESREVELGTVTTATSMTAPSLPARFVFADALRGIAAMWVVLFHAYWGGHFGLLESRLPAPALALLRVGNLGVSIFFVLSGFVISYSVSRHTVDVRFIGRFALRRAIRLDPPYWMSIGLCILFGFISGHLVPDKLFRLPDARVLAAHLLYFQEILELPEINPAYWTLCLEVQFYLVFCSLMALAHRFRRGESDRRSIHAVFVPAALLAAAWPLGIILTGPRAWLFLPYWYRFLIGVAVCWAMQRVIPLWWFYAYAVLLGSWGIWCSNSGAVACVVTAVLLMEAARRGKLAVWLNLPAFQFMGMISYSLYLIHIPITGAFYRVAYKFTDRTPAAEAFWFLPMIGVNVACAFGFWWLFERTSLALCHRVPLGKSRFPNRTEAAGSGVASEACRCGSPSRNPA